MVYKDYKRISTHHVICEKSKSDRILTEVWENVSYIIYKKGPFIAGIPHYY